MDQYVLHSQIVNILDIIKQSNWKIRMFGSKFCYKHGEVVEMTRYLVELHECGWQNKLGWIE